MLTSGQFFAPTLMAFTPAGDVLVSQQTGKIKLFKNGSVTNFLSLTVESLTDRGILGVAFDPAWPTAPYIYVYYHRPTPTIHGVISRFTVQGDQADPASETVIYTMDDLSPTGLHTGGTMAFGRDGKLYVSVGDDAVGHRGLAEPQLGPGQDPSAEQGRLHPDRQPVLRDGHGQVPIHLGLRASQPFTWAFDRTGRMLIAEVGLDQWEEIDQGAAGANYGWPIVSGIANDPRFVDPVFTYAHGPDSDQGCAVHRRRLRRPEHLRVPSELRREVLLHRLLQRLAQDVRPDDEAGPGLRDRCGLPDQRPVRA